MIENIDNKGFENIGDIFSTLNKNSVKLSVKKLSAKKPPTFKWQELALRIIDDLDVPNFKRGSVFKICKEKNKTLVEACLRDTKELVKVGEKWKYFFKLMSATDPSKQVSEGKSQSGTGGTAKALGRPLNSRYRKGIHTKGY